MAPEILSTKLHTPAPPASLVPRSRLTARLADRRGHYMSPRLIESQFHDLEEPEGAITIPADWRPDQIVTSIRSQLGR